MPTEQLIISVSEKGTLVVKRRLEELGATGEKSSKGVTMLKSALTALGAASAAVVTVRAIGNLAQFSQAMSTVQGVANATSDQLLQMREVAKELGRTTRFFAEQAGQGMVFLARSGMTAQESMEVIDDTLRLGQAGALDLATASRITTQALRGFRMPTADAARAVDVLAKAANASNTDVVQMGDALKFAGPIAKGVGVEIEEAGAAIMMLANAGMAGSMAGTGLRKVMSNLERPSETEKKVLAELGLRAEDVKVSSVGLTAALEKLAEAGMTTGHSLSLFGDRGGAAGEILTKSMGDFKRFKEMMDGAGGTAKRVADTMDDNLNGALLKLKTATEAVVIELADLGAEERLKNFILKVVDGLRSMALHMDTIAKIVTPLTVLIGVLFAQKALGLLLLMLKSVGAQFVKLWAIVLANPLMAVMALIAGAVTLLYQFRNDINVFGENFITLGDIGAAALDRIRNAFKSLGGDAKTEMDKVDEGSSHVMERVSQFGLSMIQALLQVIDKVVGTIMGFFGGVAAVVWQVIQTIKQGSVPRLSDLGTTFKDVFLEAFNADILNNAFLGTLDDAAVKAAERQQKAVEEIRKKGQKGEVTPLAPAEIEPPTPILPEQKVTFAELLAELERENMLLKLNSVERETRTRLLEMEDQLQRQLTADEAAQARTLIETNAALAMQNQLYDEIRGGQEQFALQSAALKVLLDDGRITLDEYNIKLNELKEQLLGLGKDVYAELNESLGQSLFENAASALSDFVTQGKARFSDFTRSVLNDIFNIIMRLQLMRLLTTLGVPGLGVPGFATGGAFTVGGSGGTDSQLVAFRATPGEHVAVTPPAAGNAAPAAPAAGASVKIVNSFDPGLVLDTISTAHGEQVILNVIRRNPTTIRRALGGR